MDATTNQDSKSENKTPSGGWIRYRVEHRDRDTNQILGQYNTSGLETDDIEVGHDGPAFDVVTTFRVAPPLAPPPTAGASSRPSHLSPPSYSLHLHSPAIINALQSVVQYYPSQDLTGNIIVDWPYAILVHHYDELTKFRDDASLKNENDLCVREIRAYDHIGLLLKFLDDTIMPDVLAEKERNNKGFYTFEYAWVGFKPGVTELGQWVETNDLQPRVIHSVAGGVFEYPRVPWTIFFWDMRYEGEYLGRYLGSTIIEKFDGQGDWKHVKIDDLTGGDLPEEVAINLKYGEMYWNLLRKQCRHYKGKTQKFPYNEIDGLVMADLKSYYEEGNAPPTLMNTKDCRNWTSDCKCSVCKSRNAQETTKQVVSLFEDYNWITVETTEKLTPHQYILCHYEIMAFVFKTRTWELLHVRDFAEPQFDENLIDHLVMDPQRKRTIKSLAKSFARLNKHGDTLTRNPWAADFVEGKGHGLILLLHGKPGVGKTCTAECIAAFTKRPLMVLTSSDIGTDPSTVEINLTKHFKTAKSWGAVLLIDEADVFMERRSTADLVRNSLVAGFLRALEFYDGILFLTTNRVGLFDDAFVSRVHLQLYYPDFDDDQRRQVWQTFIDKLAKERGDYMRLNVDAKDYIRGAEMRALKWNGREIRNAFQTAVSLAEYDAEKGEDGKILVTDEHLRAVVELSRDFKNYLNELHKGDEGKRAERKYERLDSYDRS
ncbi:P-loop containing nucleoside triphosphate hydrolase protein [Hypoxylon trugodes]|uniref:P-loop containing nucleoside triphosphate hydrolase protein n=1 Tax=Hypoxylon trugodes TaxID=326681 RepID=UPI00219ADC11|nr:P-loop containing nucleoside triphosphate hydrolase protein [Hypoxylon trugodes]KAI1383576.1 P-loop containing nucleoside triphosphate hydrolase protein [Hypoxylon trugodes]